MRERSGFGDEDTYLRIISIKKVFRVLRLDFFSGETVSREKAEDEFWNVSIFRSRVEEV